MIANVEAEAALLGAMMQSGKIIDPVADRVASADFSEALHGRIFEAILAQHNSGKSANPITLKPYFDDDPAMVEVGGPAYLVKIMSSSGVEMIGARDFADQVRELAQRRNLATGLQAVIEQSVEAGKPIAELVSDTEAALAEITQEQERASQLTAAECVSRVLDGFGNQATGVHCGIEPIDAGLGPLLPKQLVIVAGRPSMGKSAVASSYGLGSAAHGHGVLFISLEMSAEELGERIASDMCFGSPVQVPYSSITDGRVTGEQGMQIARAKNKLEELPFNIVDLATATIGRLNAIVRRNSRRMQAQGKKLELVIIDYLQLVRADHRTKDRYEEVSEVSRGLKALAKTHNVAVMALAQLSRGVEQRQDKRPIMADLRDSGQIEQDADSIMFLFRPEYYLQQAEPTAGDPKRVAWEQAIEDSRGKIEFIVAKRRRGRTGTALGHFFGAYQAVRA